MLRKAKTFTWSISAIFIFCSALVNGQGLVIDHNAVEMFNQIPDYWLNKAKELTVHYGHTSHGSQIIAGLNYLEDYVDPVKYSIAIKDRNIERNPGLPPAENPPALRMWEEGLWPYTNTDQNRLGYWEGQLAQEGTKNVLKSGLFNVSGWCWCGQVAENDWHYIQEYLNVLTMYEQQFPNVKFFYMTGHCIAPGPPNYQQIAYDRLQNNNKGIRDFCIKNNKVLFDFADIEAWDLAGNYHPEEDASCVWCEEWCNNHPEDCQNIPERSESGGGSNCTICAHTHGLNCVIKAKAFWYMMARLAGWDGQTHTPVELVGFQGNVIMEGIELTWTTASEHNNYGFEMMRSQNFADNFDKIGFVHGYGSTSKPNQYRFIDKNVTRGTYYYQLKQIDSDGSFRFVGKIEVSITFPNKVRLNQNFPNPFNPSSTISYSLPKQCHVKLTIFDINGKEICTLVDELKKSGSHNISFDTTNLPSGTYFYNLKSDEFNETKKMVLIQ